jgi:hypothetical protein
MFPKGVFDRKAEEKTKGTRCKDEKSLIKLGRIG